MNLTLFQSDFRSEFGRVVFNLNQLHLSLFLATNEVHWKFPRLCFIKRINPIARRVASQPYFTSYESLFYGKMINSFGLLTFLPFDVLFCVREDHNIFYLYAIWLNAIGTF